MSDISDQGMRPSHVVRDGDPESEEDLTEPSAEKESGEEPKAPKKKDPEPSHEAVGIGVVGSPQMEPDTSGSTAREDHAEEERRS